MRQTEDRVSIDGYYPTIGIECHVQLKTKTKLFASVNNDAREAPPNTLISHICLGMPGALPVLNEAAVQLASRAAFALETEPQSFSKFDRKHYFYPDLPKGYQITQFDQPIILDGRITIYVDSKEIPIAITRAHLEEDAGKSTHPAGESYSLVDLNRAGTPLLEIVSEPEIYSAAEAKAYARELYLRMKFADVSDANLFYGNMRFDVNVSVSKEPNVFGTRTETKNLNSFRSVERAVEYEIRRQIAVLESGDVVIQETRGWNDDKQETFSQRSKEDAHDYRYFPDPDIPPVVLSDAYVASVRADMGALPQDWRKKLRSFEIDQQTIETLLDAEVEFDGIHHLALFNDFSNDSDVCKRYANWVVNIFVPLIRETGELNLPIEKRGELVRAVHVMVSDNKLSSTAAKELLTTMLGASELPADLEVYAKEHGLVQVSDGAEIEKIVTEVLRQNEQAAKDVINGEMKAIGFLVGQVMKHSQGKANPSLAQQIIKKQLGI